MGLVTAAKSVGWGELRNGIKHFPLHAQQTKIVRSTARFTAAIAGTGGGKTAVGPVWIIRQLQRILDTVARGKRDINDDPILGMVIAPTYAVLQRATAPHLVRALAGTDLEGRYIPTRNIYELPNGLGLIWVLSADNPGGLEGGQFDFVWCDEGGQIKYDAWVAIQGRTGQKQAPVLITTTPYGQNWLFHHFYNLWKKNDSDYYVVQWASHVNPAYPRAEYERAKRTLSQQRFSMRYDGNFVKRSGLVYPDFDTCVMESDPLVLPGGEHIGGIDWGWNDPFAGIAGVKYIDDTGKDILYIYYERYKRETGLALHSRALPPSVTWHCDPSRPDSIAELSKAGHHAIPSYNDIIIGVDAVNGRIDNGRLRVSPACKALIAEASQYAYPEKDDETYGEKPEDSFNHALDALRYLVAGADRLNIAAHAA